MSVVIMISLVMLTVSLGLSAYRAFVGPTVADRAVALDGAAVVAMALVVVGSMWIGSSIYLDYVLVLAILSFVSTVAIAKFIERGVIFERDSD